MSGAVLAREWGGVGAGVGGVGGVGTGASVGTGGRVAGTVLVRPAAADKSQLEVCRALASLAR